MGGCVRAKVTIYVYRRCTGHIPKSHVGTSPSSRIHVDTSPDRRGRSTGFGTGSRMLRLRGI